MSQAIATIKPIGPRAEGMQLRTLDDVMRLGQAFARSGYFQDARDASQCVAKIIAGAELGFGPMASMTGIHVINGKPSLSANLIAAAIKRSGRYNFKVLDLTEKRCEIEFYEDGEVLTPTSEFTIEDAKKAGLMNGGNRGSWEKYPRNMLFARALSNGAKWHCADIFGGPVYVPEEMGAIVDGDSGTILELKPVPVNASIPADGEDEVEPIKSKDEGWMIEDHTRIRIFDLCKELEKLGVAESEWRKWMQQWVGVSSRRELTGPKAAVLMAKLADAISKQRASTANGETRDDLQKEIEQYVRTLKNSFAIDFTTIKSEMRRLVGKEKRAELDVKESAVVRDGFDLWIKRLEAQAAEDEREAITSEAEEV